MTTQQFRLPDVGEGLEEAEIVTWHVAVGDSVVHNQALVEIETAKSLVELPSPYEGTVTELLVGEGQTVQVGTPIIVIGSGSGRPVPPDGRVTADPQVPAAAVADGDRATSATGAGAGAVDAGGAVDAEPAPSVLVGYGPTETGRTRRRRRAPVPASAGSAASTLHGGAASALGVVSAPGGAPAPGSASGSEGRAASVPAGGTAVLTRATPPVRKLAKDLGVDLRAVPGSGPGDTVTRADVLQVAEAGRTAGSARTPLPAPAVAAAPSARADTSATRVAVTGVRKATAAAMVGSAFTAPHVTEFVTVDVTRSVKLVDRLKADRAFDGSRVTMLLLVARALLAAVREFPEINASWDQQANEIVLHHQVNLGIAAATPRGLMVPNIKNAGALTLPGLAGALTELVHTAREGRSTPADMSRGTITITNIGVFGVDAGTPILNPGEAAILCVGAVRRIPWEHRGGIALRWTTQLALSFDHRLVDGELGSRVLARVGKILEDPKWELLLC